MNADSVIAEVGENILGYNMFAYCFNNPVNLSDYTGNWPQLSTILTSVAKAALVVAAAAAVVAVVAFAAPALVTIGGTVLSTTAVATMAVTIGVQATTIATVSATAAIISNKVEKKYSQSYSVYFLKDENGTIQYVGRVTDRGYDTRMDYHRSTRGLTPARRISGLSYAEARGMEEIGMMECHTLNSSNPINNQIHGISPRNKNGESYMKAACDYLFNRAENWLINLLE